MRVLVVPELYRRTDAPACGTLADAVAWVREWLRLDGRLHVYWLLPPRDVAGYDAESVLADRERVTLLEAEAYLGQTDRADLFTESGYSADQLRALRAQLAERSAYVDVVVDQLRSGRFVLYKWLLEDADQWTADVRPFDIVANVHDLQLPFKYRYCSYRNEFQSRMEICAATFADGVWFTAGVDRRRMRQRAHEFLRPDVADAALDDAVTAGSPLDFSRFEQSYADEPRRFHVAGSFWAKKHADRLLDVGRRLHERFGIQTILTSMDPIPGPYRDLPWVDAFPEASQETYEWALRRGDLAVCASEYKTMARTPFEQAASGQVVVFRDEPWVYECAPDDYPLAGPPEALADLAVSAVESWDDAVAAARGLVDRAQEVRSPERSGGRTYADLRRRVDDKRDTYDGGKRVEVVERTLDGVAPPVAIDDLVERTSAHTDDGRALTDHESYAFIDLVYTLRALGWVDVGNPGTPAFAPATSCC